MNPREQLCSGCMSVCLSVRLLLICLLTPASGLATALQTIDLDNTRVNGTLPQELAFLTQLRELDLSYTLITVYL